MLRPLAKQNPFAFPNRRPGFDPSHPAAKGISPGVGFSAVAHSQGLVNLLTGKPPTLGVSAVPNVIDSLGPCFAPTAATSNVGATFSGQRNGSDANAWVFAGIVRPTSTNSVELISAEDGSADFHVRVNATTGLDFEGASGGAIVSTAINIVANTPYFVAVSGISTGSNNIFFLAVNLNTGAIQLNIVNDAVASGGAGTEVIISGGPSNSAAVSFGGRIAAVMWAPTCLRPGELLRWAQDPWSFWYPRVAVRPDLGFPIAAVPVDRVPNKLISMNQALVRASYW